MTTNKYAIIVMHTALYSLQDTFIYYVIYFLYNNNDAGVEELCG